MIDKILKTEQLKKCKLLEIKLKDKIRNSDIRENIGFENITTRIGTKKNGTGHRRKMENRSFELSATIPKKKIGCKDPSSIDKDEGF